MWDFSFAYSDENLNFHSNVFRNYPQSKMYYTFAGKLKMSNTNNQNPVTQSIPADNRITYLFIYQRPKLQYPR